jgi:hypothetical protein
VFIESQKELQHRAKPMDTLDRDTFWVLCDFLTDAELVLFYCTCRQYLDMLPRDTGCLCMLEAPLEVRENATKYIQAAKLLSGCTGAFKLTLKVDSFNTVDSIQKANKTLEVASSCIDRVLNIFLSPQGASITAGEVYSHLAFGRGAVFVRKPRFYQVGPKQPVDLIQQFYNRRNAPPPSMCILPSIQMKQRRQHCVGAPL